jgi:hypothetical protein
MKGDVPVWSKSFNDPATLRRFKQLKEVVHGTCVYRNIALGLESVEHCVNQKRRHCYSSPTATNHLTIQVLKFPWPRKTGTHSPMVLLHWNSGSVVRFPFRSCRVSNADTTVATTAIAIKATVNNLYQVAWMHGITVDCVQPSNM